MKNQDRDSLIVLGRVEKYHGSACARCAVVYTGQSGADIHLGSYAGMDAAINAIREHCPIALSDDDLTDLRRSANVIAANGINYQIV